MKRQVLKFAHSTTILTLSFLFTSSCATLTDSKPPSFTIEPKIEQNSNMIMATMALTLSIRLYHYKKPIVG